MIRCMILTDVLIPHSCAPLHQGLMPSRLDVFQWLIPSSTASLSQYLRRLDFTLVEAS